MELLFFFALVVVVNLLGTLVLALILEPDIFANMIEGYLRRRNLRKRLARYSRIHGNES